ncbi:MAG: hypothetical protein ACYTDW_03140 [Planctomycetota bacterium]|jgi:hypothetical protein
MAEPRYRVVAYYATQTTFEAESAMEAEHIRDHTRAGDYIPVTAAVTERIVIQVLCPVHKMWEDTAWDDRTCVRCFEAFEEQEMEAMEHAFSRSCENTSVRWDGR